MVQDGVFAWRRWSRRVITGLVRRTRCQCDSYLISVIVPPRPAAAMTMVVAVVAVGARVATREMSTRPVETFAVLGMESWATAWRAFLNAYFIARQAHFAAISRTRPRQPTNYQPAIIPRSHRFLNYVPPPRVLQTEGKFCNGSRHGKSIISTFLLISWLLYHLVMDKSLMFYKKLTISIYLLVMLIYLD